ncbi:MAG: hypothetical protein K2I68_07905 [Bacteroidales bacterium]|nr:hypothetical protein [Bacteroidales bacterium]
MKKLMLMLGMAALLAVPATAKAGGVYEGPAKGMSIIGLRVGLSNIVGVNATYDYALARVWKGTFTIGGQVGYMWDGSTVYWKDGLGTYATQERYSYHNISLRVRTTYRFNVVVPEWEVYGGVALGASVTPWSDVGKVNGEIIYRNSGVNAWVSGAFILGTTYHFTDALGLNLEFDFGDWATSWVNVGVNYKF